MTPEAFAYWVHGFFELADPKSLGTEQVELIKKHLDLVFDRQISTVAATKVAGLDPESVKKFYEKIIPTTSLIC